MLKAPSHDRHHLAPLRHLSLFGESPARSWPQRPRLGVGRASSHHAKAQFDRADRRLPQTPVLQIGADIYCDSQLIMRELERRHPSPSFYPAGRGAADALAWWAEKTMFLPAVSIAFAKRPEVLPEGFLEDRAKFSGRNIDPIAMMAALPNLLDQLR